MTTTRRSRTGRTVVPVPIIAAVSSLVLALVTTFILVLPPPGGTTSRSRLRRSTSRHSPSREEETTEEVHYIYDNDVTSFEMTTRRVSSFWRELNGKWISKRKKKKKKVESHQQQQQVNTTDASKVITTTTITSSSSGADDNRAPIIPNDTERNQRRRRRRQRSAAEKPLFPNGGKKGAAFTLHPQSSYNIHNHIHKIRSLNVSWNYSWNCHRYDKFQPRNITFLPMVWGRSHLDHCLTHDIPPQIHPPVIDDDDDGSIDYYDDEGGDREKKKKEGQFQFPIPPVLLTFNEPDNPTQSNMSVTEVLDDWPTLQKLGIPLSSPGFQHPSFTGRNRNNDNNDDDDDGSGHQSLSSSSSEWAKLFWDGIAKRNYRVDYIAVHWYGNPNVTQFQQTLRSFYRRYNQRPIIITEFAVADWHASPKRKHPKKNRWSPEEVLSFAGEVLPWLERQTWIMAYSWFSFDITSSVGTSSALFEKDGWTLTPLGKYYSSVGTTTTAGTTTTTSGDDDFLSMTR